jgi:arylsulfatase A-like enzyme
MAAFSLTRREFMKSMVAAGVAAASVRLGQAAENSGTRRKPNFLIIVADDMGYSDAGCYGGEIETPNLDKLAAEGLRFTQCYSTGRCWPSRTSLLTGYYPQQVRMDPPRGPLPEWTRVAPHYLKPQGYRCYHSGKWHLNGAPKAIATGGFDRSYLQHDGDRHFSPVRPGTDYYDSRGIAQYAVDFLKEHAEQNRDVPFYCYLAFLSPHFPLQALPEDIARYRDRYLEGWDVVRKRRWERMRKMGLVNCELSALEPKELPSWNLAGEKLREQIGPGEADRAVPWETLTEDQKRFQATKMAIHAAMIDRMDREIGRVLGQVAAMGAMDNTVIVFVSDNGASAEQIIRGDMHDPAAAPGSAGSYLCLGPGWSSAANAPFRLHKHWNHEGGISSPLIVHWPAGLSGKNELRHNPCHFIDILPTALDLAGVPAKEFQPADRTAPPLPGKSLTPAFARDGSVDHEFLFFHHTTHRAIRIGDWKLVARAKTGRGNCMTSRPIAAR